MSWQYFSYDTDPKLACSLTGERGMDDGFMGKLDRLRSLYGSPITINSGYRSPEYNAQISSTGETGPHTTGRAVDIAVSSSRQRSELMRILLHPDSEFTRVTPAKSFIHIDDLTEADGFSENVMWWYG